MKTLLLAQLVVAIVSKTMTVVGSNPILGTKMANVWFYAPHFGPYLIRFIT